MNSTFCPYLAELLKYVDGGTLRSFEEISVILSVIIISQYNGSLLLEKHIRRTFFLQNNVPT